MPSVGDKRLQRSNRDRMLFGVCGGLGEYFEIDPTLVRLAFVLIAFAGGSGVLAYVILAVVMPAEGREAGSTGEVVRDNLAEMEGTVREWGQALDDEGWSREAEDEERKARRRRLAGAFLVLLGVLFLAGNLELFQWLRWDRLWPLVLIALGIAILIGQRRQR